MAGVVSIHDLPQHSLTWGTSETWTDNNNWPSKLIIHINKWIFQPQSLWLLLPLCSPGQEWDSSCPKSRGSESFVCKACVSEMKAEAEQKMHRTGRACSMDSAPRSESWSTNNLQTATAHGWSGRIPDSSSIPGERWAQELLSSGSRTCPPPISMPLFCWLLLPVSGCFSGILQSIYCYALCYVTIALKHIDKKKSKVLR